MQIYLYSFKFKFFLFDTGISISFSLKLYSEVEKYYPTFYSFLKVMCYYINFAFFYRYRK
jgi:hypothetical protein